MKKIILFSVFLTFCIVSPIYAQVQELEYKLYNWEKYPKLTNTDLDTSNNSIVIFNKYLFENIYENNILFEYKLTHKRVKLITHLGIENNNKVYIPLLDEDEVVIEKARVIKNDSTVRELKKDEIKEAYDQDYGTKYRYFAFEGIEIGCEIEYIYCVKHIPSFKGLMNFVQSSIPVLYSETRYITPENLFLKFKSYNHCPEVFKDTTQKEKNVWLLKIDSIPRLKHEESAALKANMMKYLVKLDYNSVTGKKDIYAYGPISSTIYDNIYNQLDSKDLKAIKSVVKEMNFKANDLESPR